MNLVVHYVHNHVNIKLYCPPSHALVSLQKLVQQVEGGGVGLETELVKETEVLIEEFKVRESLESQLKAELVENHALLAEQKERVNALKDKKEALAIQVSS